MPGVLPWPRARKHVPHEPSTHLDQIGHLKAAVADARVIVAFTVKTNRRVEDKVIDDLMKAIAELGDLDTATRIDPDKEAPFWTAYQGLTNATKPVTAQSILESERANERRWGTTGNHGLIAGIIFLILAALQMMWVTGTTLRKDLDASDVAIDKVQDALKPNMARQQDLLDELDRLDGTFDPKRHPTTEAEKKRLVEARAELSKLQPQISDSRALLERLRTQREPVVKLLQGWYEQVTFKRWPMNGDARVKDLGAQLEELKKSQEDRRVSSLVRLSLERQLARAQDERVGELKRRVDVILNALQQYVFPVLLGLLGALTFILRSLIVQIRDYSYLSSFSGLSFVRVCLGMMAGLLGGMLIPGDQGIMKTLSPLALSFLLGYAVEVLFAFLDRLVHAFTSERQQPARA